VADDASPTVVTAAGADHRLRRWGLVAAILGVTAIIIVILVLRAIPKQGEAQLEIAGWKAPVGVVVSTDEVSSHLPGVVVRSLLGNEPVIQVNGGRVEEAGADKLRIKSFSGNDDITYTLTDTTKTLNIRNPLLRGAATVGESVAVLTKPNSHDALLVLTGVTRAN
jgi:hypothetical protein